MTLHECGHDAEALPYPATSSHCPACLIALLSPREREVAECIATGMRTSAIAAALGISVKTVSSMRARILQKLRARSNAYIAVVFDRVRHTSRKE